MRTECTSASRSNTPGGIYKLKFNSRITRTRCEICLKLTIKIPEQRQWRRSGVFIFNFEYISHHVLVFLLLRNFRWKYIKNESCKSHLGIKEQKVMFPVVSGLHEHYGVFLRVGAMK